MRLTLNSISKEIKKQTGIDNLMLKGKGYFYFVNPSATLNLLDYADTSSVHVGVLSQIPTMEDWVQTFKGLIKNADLPTDSSVDPFGGVIKLGKRV